MLKGGKIAATYKSHVPVWIDLLPHGFIATSDLMIEELHSLMEPDKCPVFVGGPGKNLTGNNDVVDVVKDCDGRVG
jgi:hypothetical protein